MAVVSTPIIANRFCSHHRPPLTAGFPWPPTVLGDLMRLNPAITSPDTTGNEQGCSCRNTKAMNFG